MAGPAGLNECAGKATLGKERGHHGAAMCHGIVSLARAMRALRVSATTCSCADEDSSDMIFADMTFVDNVEEIHHTSSPTATRDAQGGGTLFHLILDTNMMALSLMRQRVCSQ